MAGKFKTVVVELAVYVPEDNEHIYKGEEDFLEYVENEFSELEYRGIYIERFIDYSFIDDEIDEIDEFN
tara:strand:- start:364 stop:570 length:207 start_codon:yes stop_codon:yes gene_type:complete